MTLIAPLERQLCFGLYAAGHAMSAFYAPLLSAIGLTYPQYLVLIALWNGDDRTVSELGADLGLGSNTLTPLLKRMAAAGLITRTRDDRDERLVRVRLTDAGRAKESEAADIPGKVLAATGLDMAGAMDLKRRLAELRARLAEAG